MADLLGGLSMAARSLEAVTLGLQVTGQNIANAGTAGYSRRVVDYVAIAPNGPRDAGGGVLASGIRAPRDLLLERQLLVEQPLAEREGAIADALGTVEVSLGQGASALDARLSAFFDAFGRLADEPASGVARQEVLLEGEALAEAFQEAAARLEQSRAEAYAGVRSAADEINAIADRMAQLNASVGTASGPGLQATDDLWRAAGEMAKLADIRVVQNGDGTLDVTLSDGHALVIGRNSYELSASLDGEGRVQLTNQGADVTAAITSGRLGGLIQVSEETVPGYLEQLDALAAGVAGQVNAIHSSAFDLGGEPAGVFFVPVSGAGAAASMAMDPAVLASPELVGAASQPYAGDNGAARAIAALRDARVLRDGTATFHDSWGNLVYSVGRDASAAAEARSDREATVRQIETLKDQVTGVSLDEEAANMQRLQRAYEANARYFTAIDRTLDLLMQMVGG